MFKDTMFDIARKLCVPYLLQENTSSSLAISIKVHVSFALYELAQGVNMPICLKLFVIN
jgi:hypothetical protein